MADDWLELWSGQERVGTMRTIEYPSVHITNKCNYFVKIAGKGP